MSAEPLRILPDLSASNRESWAAPMAPRAELGVAILESSVRHGHELTLLIVASALLTLSEQIARKPGAKECWLARAFAKSSEEMTLLAAQCKDATE